MDGFRVLIAGGGVAGLETMLALDDLASEFVEVAVLDPADAFVYRPLLVAEPFGLETHMTTLDLAPMVEAAGARHIRDALESVQPVERTVTTVSGERIDYDALVVALGARPVEALPGALTFGADAERGRFGKLLGELGRRGVKRLAFVVPDEATWSIAAYELALLTAAECHARRLSGVELSLVTHESAPLELFGADASQLVAARLSEAGITVRLRRVAVRFADNELGLADGDSLRVDQVVALPGLEVPLIPGLPQGERGFVVTDMQMRVSGLEAVWAAGDVASFPVKQGGLAAQQADVAARAIAANAGARVPLQTYQPVLRAALITGGALDFLRARIDEEGAADTSAGQALWLPPAKLAGNYLGPLIARAAGTESPHQLVDVDPSDDPEVEQAGQDRARELVLAAADADARLGHFETALRWLELIERLDLVLPTEYVARRHEWRRELDPAAIPGPAAQRIEPGFVSTAAALSDLQRRIGWLREIEHGTEGEMRAHLAELDAGLAHLLSLSRRTSR